MIKRPIGQLTRASLFVTLIVFSVHGGLAQSNTFTYEGKFSDNGNPASGNYDLQFTLWDAVAGGTQQPQPGPITLSRNNVAVAGGVFTVQLDFTVNAFPGADRFLEISVRPAGVGSFTTLSPRQQISSTPYAIRTLSAVTADNATQLGGIQANQYVKTNDTRLTDARAPTPGSSEYIQSNPASAPQAGATFNINGNGTAAGTLSGNIINSGTQYNLGGSRILSAPGANNVFAGFTAGQSNTSGSGNVFVGPGAGQANTTSSNNSYFGFGAGQNTTTTANAHNNNSFFGANAGRLIQGSGNSIFGSNAGGNSTQGEQNSFFGFFAGFNNTASGNSFFGTSAGQSTTSGDSNSFFGAGAGGVNRTGSQNSFFGIGAGQSNNAANNNSFFGAQAGANNTADGNAFFGSAAGQNNTTGSSNSFFGTQSGSGNFIGMRNSFFGANATGTDALSNATAIGADAQVTQSNSLILGSIAGVNAATADTHVGIGVTAPNAFNKLEVAGALNRVAVFASGNGTLGTAIKGSNSDGTGVAGDTSNGIGIAGTADGDGTGVGGNSLGNGIGVLGFSHGGIAVKGSGYFGVYGVGNNVTNNTGLPFSYSGVVGQSDAGIGVVAVSGSGFLMAGVSGNSPSNYVERFHILNNGTYVAGSDFAEALPALGTKSSYEPGDVLILSSTKTGAIEKSSRPYDRRIAGVYSTRPGMLGADKQGATRVDAEDVPVGIIGVVPTKVSTENGPISVGDLLVTARVPGYAMRCGQRSKCVGATLGKAMEPLLQGHGTIKVLVMLR